ncbi:hypothetical protein RJO15_08035 [Herbaspirillum huttiense F1]|uniref:DUF6941 family protein n=1 Tax=Herbaspirillum huttiense TaxID=863372 RepID=UPI002886000E|nr:hypothetical protein [Herbaspirillum huttiense]MDT0355710.1 hypothetical protein [Herbaspirillum huttiense F1]
MNNRQIYVIYCDDIRVEMGNKQSLMGVYNTELVVPNLPTSLPKLAICVRIFTPADQPFKEIFIKAMLDDQVLGEAPADPSLLKEMKMSPAFDEDGKSVCYGEISIIMAFAPFVIPHECRLKIHVTIDGELFKGPPLLLRTPLENESVSFAPV